MANKFSILVVDDDCDNADSLAELFEMEGHDVTVAYNGEDAVEAYKTGNFDLAFMDVVMPGLNGVESFLEIKRMQPNANVYMMTGYSVEQLLRQATDNGALGILVKPIDPTEILRAVENVRPDGIILVAEDDPDFGATLQEMISESGRQCELVTDDCDFLSRINNQNVEVLILDLSLPLMDGVDVYSTLRKRGNVVPTIMISSSLEQYKDTLDGLSDIRVTGVLNKPFEPANLLQQLEFLTVTRS